MKLIYFSVNAFEGLGRINHLDFTDLSLVVVKPLTLDKF